MGWHVRTCHAPSYKKAVSTFLIDSTFISFAVIKGVRNCTQVLDSLCAIMLSRTFPPSRIKVNTTLGFRMLGHTY